jgi:tol-pal system protein YbgF
MTQFKIASVLIAVSLLGAGCSTFSRANRDAENAAENADKNTYSADEPATPDALKDEKIQHLESTVRSLNSRIQELEGKLQAVEARPDRTANPSPDRKSPDRQRIGGTEVDASVAPSDPGAGFVNDAAVRAFQQGKILFDQEKYPEAILAFSAFLEGNPEHPFASSAQYFIGESYYREGDYAVADQEFRKLTTRYPQSPRVSYALVRLSQSAGALGKTEEAKRYQTQAEGLFPKSPALKLLREAPVGMAADAAQAETPIATAPGLAIERPTAPTIEVPTVEKPKVEVPPSNAPRARVSGDLDGPPGGGG